MFIAWSGLGLANDFEGKARWSESLIEFEATSGRHLIFVKMLARRQSVSVISVQHWTVLPMQVPKQNALQGAMIAQLHELKLTFDVKLGQRTRRPNQVG